MKLLEGAGLILSLLILVTGHVQAMEAGHDGARKKTREEHVKLLTDVASAEVVEAFKKLWKEGKRIHVIQMRRQYQILE